MLRVIVDTFAVLIQMFINARFFLSFFPVKEPYKKSIFFIYVQLTVSYIFVNYVFNSTPPERITAGVIIYVIFGMFYLEGGKLRQIRNAVLEYLFILGMDLILQFVFFPSFSQLIVNLPPLDQKMLGRNLATASLFLFLMVYELFIKWKEEKKRLGVTVLAVIFAGVQLIILNLLAHSNPEDMLESRLIFTAIFSMVMMGGYLVVNELFKQILNQHQKQNELEQMALESKYQYDYYQKALAQGERIRDIRHDMGNQLQTVEYLLCSESEEDRKRAEEMVEMLSEKAGGVC